MENLTKGQILRNGLRALISRHESGARLPTVAQLCNRFNVSIVTLDRALHALEQEEIVQRKHGSGIFVARTIGQKTIGIVYDFDASHPGAPPFFPVFIREIQARAAAKNERVRFYFNVSPGKTGAPSCEVLLNDIQAHRLHGIIFIDTEISRLGDWFAKQTIPCATFTRRSAIPWRIQIDYARLINCGVRALIKQGCRRIGLLAFPWADQTDSDKNLNAFRKAMAQADLPVRPEFIVIPFKKPYRGAISKQSFEEAAFCAINDLLVGVQSRTGRTIGFPDGFVSVDDTLTRGALMAFQKNGFTVGRDILVATHANVGSPALLGFENDVTLLQIVPALIVDELFKMLEDRMNGKSTKNSVVFITPRLIVPPRKLRRKQPMKTEKR